MLDPQGKTVQSALEHMGYQGIMAVHVGKYLEIAPRFSRLDDAKRVFPVRHLEIARVVTGDLQESACTVLRAAAGRKVSTKNAAPL